MNETALYYTLSTVSQTLAGALGMLAAFLALRVSALETAFRAIITEAELRTTSLGRRPTSGSMAETLKGWRENLGEGQLAGGGYNVTLYRRAEHCYIVKTALLRQTTLAFAVSAAVMGTCFTGLACAPWLSSNLVRAWGAAGLAVVGGVACLARFGWIVREALAD